MKIRLSFVLMVACATPQQQTQPKVAMGAQQSAAIASEADTAWEGRAERAKLESAIHSWETVVKASPADWQTWFKIARAYYWLAEGYVAFEANSDARYLATHDKGMKAGEQAIRNYSEKTRKQFDLGAKIEQLAPHVDKDGVPAMYWYASCLGRWAKKQGVAKAVLYKDLVRQVMERARELDENYYYAAPIRYFGGFYAFAPAFAGGDVEKGRQFFEEAIKRFPGYLGTRVLFADIYAVKMQDNELFKRQLQMVLAEKDDVQPEIIWENQVAKKQAERLLAKMNEVF